MYSALPATWGKEGWHQAILVPYITGSSSPECTLVNVLRTTSYIGEKRAERSYIRLAWCQARTCASL